MTDVAEVRERLRKGFAGTIREMVPLAEFTTFRIGGPASLLAVPEGREDLSLLLSAVGESGLPLLVLGRGSNVLVSDRGFDGVVVVVGKGLQRITRKGKCEVYVEGGCDLNRLINWAIEMGLGGLEDLAGIPASVGGAVRMNAGACGSTIGQSVTRVAVMGLEGYGVKVRELKRKDLDFSYRHSNIAEGHIVFEAGIELHEADAHSLYARRGEVMAWRRENQPLRQPSAGSVFRNPPGAAAGELIDGCGLKGTRIGGAMVSEMHANFIVNVGGARAEDVYRLIVRIKDEVMRREGVQLHEEIRLVGEMGEGVV
ncbi:MAG: UDP-N-acetylmuramate dehydrogenase [Actinomycetota bacterium]